MYGAFLSSLLSTFYPKKDILFADMIDMLSERMLGFFVCQIIWRAKKKKIFYRGFSSQGNCGITRTVCEQVYDFFASWIRRRSLFCLPIRHWGWTENESRVSVTQRRSSLVCVGREKVFMIKCLWVSKPLKETTWTLHLHATRMSSLFIIVVLPRCSFGHRNVPLINVEGVVHEF